MMSM